MRILYISLIFTCFSFTACVTTTSLPTETDEIDISGRWNATDSEIGASELINKLIKSSWYAAVKKEAGNIINFEVKPVSGSDGKSLGKSYESIQEAFNELIAQQQNWRRLQEGQTTFPIDYSLVPTIKLTETESKKETVYFYTLEISVFDSKKELVYKAKETVKKYIKN